MKLQPVHLRINDQETGQPTPCRIRISDASGNEYAPFGRSLNFSTGRGEDVGGHLWWCKERWFSIDGTCEIAIPPGELRMQVRKGIEFVPIDEAITLPVGKMALRFALQRGIRRQSEGWVAVDTRCHFLTPHAALLDGAASDLDVVNLLVESRQYLAQDGHSYDQVSNLEAYSGQSPCLKRDGVEVFINTRNRHPLLGSLGLLNTHRIVYPLTFGGPDATDDWSLRDWCQQCHRKGGLAIWTESFLTDKPHAGEGLALAILGEIDALELAEPGLPMSLLGWARMVEAGTARPIVGASGCDSTRHPVGCHRTLVRPFDGSWVEGIRHGQTQITNGPIINLHVEPEGRIHATAKSVMPFGKLEIVEGRQVIASSDAIPGDVHHAEVSAKVEPPALIAARASPSFAGWPPLAAGPVLAHTSAQWIGEPFAKPQAAAFLLEHLRKGRDWVDTEGRFDDPKSKVKLLDTFAEAIDKLQRMPMR